MRQGLILCLGEEHRWICIHGKEEGQGERGEARQAEKGRIVRESAVDREREREQHTETKEETKRPIQTRDRNRQQDTAETEPGQPAL